MRKELPLVSSVVAVGHGLPFIVCLLTLETVPSPEQSPSAKQARLAPHVVDALQEMGVSVATVEEARENKDLMETIIHGVQNVNMHCHFTLGSDPAPVKRFFILSHDLRLEDGDLTPMLELRRSVIVKKFSNIIEDIYDDSIPGHRKMAQGDRAPRSYELGKEHAGAGMSDMKGDALPSLTRREPFAAVQPNAQPNGSPSVDGEMSSQVQTWQNLGDIFRSPNMSALRAEMSLNVSQDKPLDFWAHEDERQQRMLEHAQLEEAVLHVNPAISNVMVVGEEHPGSFLSCLISLKTMCGNDEALHQDALAAAHTFDSTAETVMQAKDDPNFRAFLIDSISHVNRQFGRPDLAIRKFIIVLVDFLPAVVKLQGPSALTMPMRDSVKRRFDKIIDSIYDSPNAGVTGTPASNIGGVVGTSFNQAATPGGGLDSSQENDSQLQSGMQAALRSGEQQYRKATTTNESTVHGPMFPQDEVSEGGVARYPPTYSQDEAHDEVMQAQQRRSQNGFADAAVAEAPNAPNEVCFQSPRGWETLASDGSGFVQQSNIGALYLSGGRGAFCAVASDSGTTPGRTLYPKTPAARGQGVTDAFGHDLKSAARARSEQVQIVLDMDMAHVLFRMQAFCCGLHSDLCTALDSQSDRVVIRSIRAGSVVVCVALLPSDHDNRSALALVGMLQVQAKDSQSVLRQGAYTRSLISVTHMSSDEVLATHAQASAAENASMTCGVGLVLEADDRDRVRVARIIPGSPAAMTREVICGDIVTDVDGKSTAGMTADAVVASLHGDKGSLVRVAVMRGDDVHTIYMIRGSSNDSISPVIEASTTKHHVRGLDRDQTPASNHLARTNGAGMTKGRLSIGASGSSSPYLGPTGESHRALQIVNMGFEAVKVLVWRRTGEVLVEQEIIPNGAFPDEGNGCDEHWPIPSGRDLCFTVVLCREMASRKSFCLPDFDKRSVRVRVEVDSEKGLLSVAPALRKGKPIQGNVDAYSLRLNSIPETSSIPVL